MKDLLNYIMEYKGHATHKGEKSIGDPDEVRHYFRQGYIHLKMSFDNGYPFIYNKKSNDIIIGKGGTIHNFILSGTPKSRLEEMGLTGCDSAQKLRYCCGLDDDTEAIDDWYEKNKQYVDNLICGRIWYDAWDNLEVWDDDYADVAKNFPEVKDIEHTHLYICNWNEIMPSDFKNINDTIVKLFCKEKSIKIDGYIAIDNNGEPIEIDSKSSENIKVDKRSESYKKDIDDKYDMHTDPNKRKEKWKATAEYRKNRDEKNQKIYNHTKSKTEAEWRSLRYQENNTNIRMKNLINYIYENQKSAIKKRVKENADKEFEVYTAPYKDGEKWAAVLIKNYDDFDYFNNAHNETLKDSVAKSNFDSYKPYLITPNNPVEHFMEPYKFNKNDIYWEADRYDNGRNYYRYDSTIKLKDCTRKYWEKNHWIIRGKKIE